MDIKFRIEEIVLPLLDMSRAGLYRFRAGLLTPKETIARHLRR